MLKPLTTSKGFWQDRWQGQGLQWIALILLISGISFRLIAIDHKIYWHDESYTSFRAAGFTRSEIDQSLFQNRLVSVPELQAFQQIKPNSTYADTLHSLITEDPQHPPLYFWMARFWMQQFGGSILVSRLLPILISLVSLPLMYGLAMELFISRSTALLATGLLALSPVDILFAQTARQYSLLTLMVLGSGWLLLRAMRRMTWQEWVGYSLTVALGLYTHPFFALIVVAHGVYTLGFCAVTDRPSRLSWNWGWLKARLPWLQDRRLWQFCVAVAIALVLYGPWIGVLFNQQERALATTDWARVEVSFFYLLKMWTLSFTSLLNDLYSDAYPGLSSLSFLLRLPFVLLIGAAFYHTCRHPALSVKLFPICTAVVPFLLLLLPDLVLGGKRSAVSRYLIPCYPGIQLAVAYLLSRKWETGKQFWRGVLAFTMLISVLSCGLSAGAESWWNKDLSYYNAETIRRVNAEVVDESVPGGTLPSPNPGSSPILLSDIGDYYTNTGDLISLSYGLKDSVQFFLTSPSPDFTALHGSFHSPSNILVFRPSKPLLAAIEQQGWHLELVSNLAGLWRLEKK